jgi:hypothetical protein
MMFRRCIPAGLVLLLAIFLSGPRAGAAQHTVYTWVGYDCGSHLLVPKFLGFWRSVTDSPALVVQNKPSAAAMLAGFQNADIVYGTTHSGVPKGGAEQALQVGKKGTPGYVLTASQIAASNCTRPKLVVINGCATFPLLDEEAGQVRNLSSGFGIHDNTKGRAYIGFRGVHAGIRGDGYFRIFFAVWRTEKLTLAAAKVRAVEFIDDHIQRFGGDAAGKRYITAGDSKIANDLEILGDDTLRYADL